MKRIDPGYYLKGCDLYSHFDADGVFRNWASEFGYWRSPLDTRIVLSFSEELGILLGRRHNREYRKFPDMLKYFKWSAMR